MVGSTGLVIFSPDSSHNWRFTSHTDSRFFSIFRELNQIYIGGGVKSRATFLILKSHAFIVRNIEKSIHVVAPDLTRQCIL